MSHKRALEGVKAVEFAYGLTSTLVGKYLADFGAQVVKIETMTRPDMTRTSLPFKDGVAGVNRASMFAMSFDGRYSMSLNLSNPLSDRVSQKLVIWADVVFENFTPGAVKRMHFDYDTLKGIKKDIIMVSMSMMGQYGPYASQPGWGHNLKGLAGFSQLTGWPDRDACGLPSPYTDYITPWFGVVAIMAALEHRRRTGEGQYVDVSAIESSIQFLSPLLLDYSVNGRVQTRRGNRSSCLAPHGAYRCRGSDRWCAIAVRDDQQWHAFCRVLGNPSWTSEPRFATVAARLQAADELDKLVEDWTVNHTPEEVMIMMQEAGVPAGVVQTSEDLMHRDVHLKERDFFPTMNYEEIGAVRQMRLPCRLSKTPDEIRHSPRLGEHTEYVCTEFLGMTDDEFLELLSSGVFD